MLHSGFQPPFLVSQNARRDEQNAYVPELAGVAELADALDSKSTVLLGNDSQLPFRCHLFEKPGPLHRIALESF